MGAVGTEMIKTLEQRNYPVSELVPLDIPANAGKTVTFRGSPVQVRAAQEGAFRGVDVAIFSAGADASKVLAPLAASEGAIVVDNSSQWRMDPSVPLVVPEVNPQALDGHKGIIANPNCSTIQMLVALKPIHDAYKIKRVVVSTYQAVSGTGGAAIAELTAQAKAFASGRPVTSKVYPRQILFNALPHIDVFLDNGYTREEMKMVNETRKMLHDDSVMISATAVRVPVFYSHSEAIHIETERKLTAAEAREILSRSAGVTVVDDPAQKLYPMPLFTSGQDNVWVGRIREDVSHPRGLALWVAGDQLRKGAATNAVQIAEILIRGK